MSLLLYCTMILQRLRIIVGDARFEPGTSDFYLVEKSTFDGAEYLHFSEGDSKA